MDAQNSVQLPAGPLLRGDVPLYRQLEAVLRRSIIERRFEAGQHLPTEEELAHRFQVSRITVRQALRELDMQGLIARRAALGTVVLTNRPSTRQGWAIDSLEDIVNHSRNTRMEVLGYDLVRDEVAAEKLGLMPTDRIYRLKILRLIGHSPLAESELFLLPSVGCRLSISDFNSPIIFHIIQERCGIRLLEARQTVWAEVANRRLASRLKCPEGSAVLVVQRVYVESKNVPVEFAVSRYRGDHIKLSYGIRQELGR